MNQRADQFPGVDIDAVHAAQKLSASLHREEIAPAKHTPQGANRDASAGQSHEAVGCASPTGRGENVASARAAAPVFLQAVGDRLIERALRRPPDFVIGGADRPYLRRWWVIPRNRLFNVYLHQFLRSDDDRAHHTHPWLFNFSWLLRGPYVEHVIERGGLLRRTVRLAGAMKFRWGASPHRLELVDGHPCWTLFITGPRVREWGFFCGDRFVHWKVFTAADDPGSIGKGCEA